MESSIIYDWNKLEEVDFKVYSGEPKITLRLNGDNSNYQESIIDHFSEKDK